MFYVNENYINIQNSSGNFTEKYVYQDGQLVAQVNSNGNKEFIHDDNLGSTSLITDASGNVVENEFYSQDRHTQKKKNYGYFLWL